MLRVGGEVGRALHPPGAWTVGQRRSHLVGRAGEWTHLPTAACRLLSCAALKVSAVFALSPRSTLGRFYTRRVSPEKRGVCPRHPRWVATLRPRPRRASSRAPAPTLIPSAVYQMEEECWWPALEQQLVSIVSKMKPPGEWES